MAQAVFGIEGSRIGGSAAIKDSNEVSSGGVLKLKARILLKELVGQDCAISPVVGRSQR